MAPPSGSALPAEPLAERVLVHACVELGDDGAVPPQPQLPLESPFDRFEPQLVEPVYLALREVGERELAERRPAPEREGFLERRDCPGRVVVQLAPPLGGEDLEPSCVDCVVGEPEEVSRRLRHEHSALPGRLEDAAKVGDVALERLRGRRRRLLAPQRIDEPVRRDHLSASQSENGQQRPLASGRKLHRLAGVVANLERAEDSELHRTSRLASLAPLADRALTAFLPLLTAFWMPRRSLRRIRSPRGRAGRRRRHEMKAHRFGITVVAVASVATAIGAGAAVTGNTPPWLKALNERSEALNQQYGLGDHAERRQLGSPGPDWLKALEARSEAMNRYYGLGQYARQGARSSSTPDWLFALNARSDALNRKYGLGEYSQSRDAGTAKGEAKR